MEDRLAKLVKVVEAGSFTKAAAELHISQPALTAAIRKLERELHASLLVRGRHGAALTPAGRIAYRAGLSVLNQAQNLKRELAELTAQKIPLALGAIDSVAEILFVQHQELPRLEEWAEVSLTINNSSLLAQDVAQHKLDLALVAESATLAATLTTQPLGAEPLVVVTHRDHLAQTRQQLRGGKLADFLSYNQNSHTHQLLVETAQARGVTLKPNFYSTSPAIILKLVLGGRGVAALPYLQVKPHLNAGTIAPVKLGNSCLVERRIACLSHANQYVPTQLSDFLEQTQQQLAVISHEAKEQCQ